MKYALFSALILLSGIAHSAIDMKNGNYTNTFIDIIVPGSGYDLRVARTYNSRSLFNGLFGFGWCSDFETSLKKTGEGNLLITECGAGQQVLFTSGDSQKSLEATVNKIVAEVKKRRGSTLTKEYYEKFTKNLFESVELRTTYAERLKLDSDVQKGVRYKANGREVEEIVFTGKHYTRTLADGSSQRFDTEGRMTHVYDKNMNFLKLTYAGAVVKEVADNNGRKLTFMYDANKKLDKIIGPNDLKSDYTFTAVDDLKWVNNGWGNEYTHTYDDLHNLTSITYPDKTKVSLTYNKERDWVMSFSDRDKCTEAYDYVTSKDDPENHYWSTVTKTCDKKVVAKNRYEFWYRAKADKSVYLHRVLTNINKQETDIIYHAVFGKPISIRKNSFVTEFEYYANGLARVKKTDRDKMEFFYDQTFNKVNRIVHSFFNEKGKVASKRISEFKYNPKGNMNLAKNSLGQEISLEYDARGRIFKIKDQAAKEVTIKYEERFGKPHIVTRTGLGSIKMDYNGKGEIDKVDSKQGPEVATQVASTLNHLLEIIAPASTEIYL